MIWKYGITKVRGGYYTKVNKWLGENEKELKDLCSQLKKMCGTGGALKNSIIEIQGDNRDKIKATLEQLGHNVKLAGG